MKSGNGWCSSGQGFKLSLAFLIHIHRLPSMVKRISLQLRKGLIYLIRHGPAVKYPMWLVWSNASKDLNAKRQAMKANMNFQLNISYSSLMICHQLSDVRWFHRFVMCLLWFAIQGLSINHKYIPLACILSISLIYNFTPFHCPA